MTNASDQPDRKCCDCVDGVVTKSLPIMVSGIHVDDTEPLPMKCPCSCHDQPSQTEEKRFYTARKFNVPCVMDRNAGVDWDCIRARCADTESGKEFAELIINALNAPADTGLVENKKLWEFVEAAANCPVRYGAFLRWYQKAEELLKERERQAESITKG